MLELFGRSLLETMWMVGAAGLMGAVLGIPLGVALCLGDRGGILERPGWYRVAATAVNAVCSTPFIVLLVAVNPLARWLTGSSIGTAAAVVPLALAAAPLVARLVEAALREVDAGLIDAARAMGATPRQIVFKVLLPESLARIVGAITVAVVSLTGYSAMAGALGGAGLGDLAIRYGYQRFQPAVMAAVVLVLILFVQAVQILGDALVRRLSHR